MSISILKTIQKQLITFRFYIVHQTLNQTTTTKYSSSAGAYCRLKQNTHATVHHLKQIPDHHHIALFTQIHIATRKTNAFVTVISNGQIGG